MTDETKMAETAGDPMAELDAMRQVAEALTKLDAVSRGRVLNWALGFFAGGGRVALAMPTRPTNAPPGAFPGIENQVGEIHDIATLFSRAVPSTEAEKALVAGYFFQRVQGAEDFDSFTINSELKHLGHKVTNITRALGGLMALRPQLIVQTRKEGKSRQARKRYKLTVEGQRRVERMVAEAGSPS